jgi:hypothetical protein
MTAPRRLATTFVAIVFLAAGARASQAYDVEADSTANTVFVLLWNGNPTASFESISISEDLPGIVAQATASITPASVPANGSDLAAIDFDIEPGAMLGASGDLVITVSGTASGQPLDVVLEVPLVVVAVAPEAQGVVGTGIPAPDPGGVDSDGDGVTDALETAFGSDPLDPASMPGKTVEVPSLEAIGLTCLAALLMLCGVGLTRRRQPQASCS